MIIKKGLALALAASFVIMQTMPAYACAPAFPEATMFNTLHPDLPLRPYAAGDLGVIAPTYAKSYLCVAYRYLSGLPLDAVEQKSMCRLWHFRLSRVPDQDGGLTINKTIEYLKLRKAGLKAISKSKNADDDDPYSYTDNVSADALSRASATLTDLIKGYGAGSAATKEWITAQDQVFASAKDGQPKTLVPLTGKSDKLLQDHRKYQTAAMAFYTKNYLNALKLYKEIEADKQSPWHTAASYMVARTGVAAVDAGDKDFDYDQVLADIDKKIASTSDFDQKQDLIDLRAPFKYGEMSREALIETLQKGVLTAHNNRFGADVGDLTYAMDEMEGSAEQAENEKDEAAALDKHSAEREALMSKYDLTDWLETYQSSERLYEFYSVTAQAKMKEARKRHAEHALAMYNKTHSLPWLVAAISLNGLRGDQHMDLVKAAQAVPAQSVAADTVNFYIIDRLLSQDKNSEARSRLSAVLSKKSLSTTNQNIFRSQMLAAAQDTPQYLQYARMRPAEIGTYYSYVPENWVNIEKTGKAEQLPYTFDDTVAINLNRHLPLADLVAMTLKESDPVLKGRLAKAAWLKAHLLGRPDQAHKLTEIFARSYPQLAQQIRAVDSKTGDQSKYELAKMTLKNFGLTPYLASGIERHGQKVGEFDYYNCNYWVPLALKEPKPDPNEMWAYYADNSFDKGCSERPKDSLLLEYIAQYFDRGVSKTLSAQEQKTAKAELASLHKASPSEFMGEAVFRKLKSSPGDKDLPEALYHLVKIPKWSARTEIGSSYSHRAYNLLQMNYKGSKFAQRAPYWY